MLFALGCDNIRHIAVLVLTTALRFIIIIIVIVIIAFVIFSPKLKKRTEKMYLSHTFSKHR